MTKDNHLLGELNLNNVSPAPIGTTKSEVTFSIDYNVILNVSAVEKGAGIQKEIQITNDEGRLSQEEIYCKIILFIIYKFIKFY